MKKLKVLFICIHNSARSQMAEAFLNKIKPGKYVAESAGIEPGVLNPVVVDAMQEIGIDISNNKTKDVNHFLNKNENFDFVITVCDEASAERCPVFPGKAKRLHWSFLDPSAFQGTKAKKLAMTQRVRDAIKIRVEKFVELNA